MEKKLFTSRKSQVSPAAAGTVKTSSRLHQPPRLPGGQRARGQERKTFLSHVYSSSNLGKNSNLCNFFKTAFYSETYFLEVNSGVVRSLTTALFLSGLHGTSAPSPPSVSTCHGRGRLHHHLQSSASPAGPVRVQVQVLHQQRGAKGCC